MAYDINKRLHSNSQIEISLFLPGKRCGQKDGLEVEVSESLEVEKEMTTLMPRVELCKAEVTKIF